MRYLTIILLLLLLGCDKSSVHKKVQLFRFWGLGTQLQVQYYDIKKSDIEQKVIQEIRTLEQELSYYKKGSYIDQINHADPFQQITVSADICQLIKQAKAFTPLTEGRFDVTYKSSGILWDQGVLPSHLEIERHLKKINIDLLDIDCTQNQISVKQKGVLIDLGGIAKGYLIDRTATLLKKNGVNHFIINYGGDLLVCGQKGINRWQVGIKNPKNPLEYLEILKLDHHQKEGCTGVATSGDYERFVTIDGKQYSHILNPKTGFPVKNGRSITVVGGSALLTDTLATAISVGVNDDDYIQKMVDRFQLTVYLLRGDEERLITYRKGNE